MYVICQLFYAIGGGWLICFFIGQDWPIDYLYIDVSERDDLCHFLLITEFYQ